MAPGFVRISSILVALVIAVRLETCALALGMVNESTQPNDLSLRFIKHEGTTIIDFTGADVELSCKAVNVEGDSRPPKVTWFKDKTPISRVHRRMKAYKTRRWRLEIQDVEETDSGSYTCVVRNSFGSINRTFDVDIKQRPILRKPMINRGQPGNQTVAQGVTVSLRCEVL
jgi:hypothetical protein